MSGHPLPHHQSISHVSVQQGSRAYVGTFSNCDFGNADKSEEASEQAAVACRNALFLTDTQEDRRRVINVKGTRVAGTCEWITHDAKYLAWLSGDNNGDGSDIDNTRLLWISGGPGKGKTMLSVYLIEELEKHTARADNVELTFFFCSAEDEKRNTAVAVLRGLVHEIIAKRPHLVKHALPYFETPERTQQTLSSLEALWLIFSKLIADAELGTMFCVLDGLDECEEDSLKTLLLMLVGLFANTHSASTGSAFNLVIASRNIHGLQHCRRIRLDPDNNGIGVNDVKLFVRARIRELSKIEGFTYHRVSVKRDLLEGAEGTFLWVGFAMQELLQKQTCTEVLAALEEMPRGLPAIYSRMVLRIQARHRAASRSILLWVTTAMRPLQLQELAAAVGIQPTSPQITVDQAVRDAVVLCGPLLKVQEQAVSLVHQSARDYLLRTERDSNTVLEAFRFDAESAHSELARQCLNCIAQNFLQHKEMDLSVRLGSQESPLLQYAVLHWPEHAKHVPARDARLVHTLRQFFCDKHALRRHWWKAYRNKKLLSLPEPIPLLHMLCYLGLISIVEEYVSWEAWKPRLFKRMNKKDSSGNTALHLAIGARNHGVAKVLIGKGADVNTSDRFRRTPLQRAVEEGDTDMVQLLIQKGAKINVENDYGRTALHLAASGGSTKIVQCLVQGGADVNTIDMGGDSVLYSAIGPWETSGTIVLTLVNKGADLNRKEYDESTVLHRAAKRGNEAVTRLLVENGAVVNAKDKYGRTALHWAAEEGHEAVVRLLVENGAVVNAKDESGRTALHLAAGEVESMVVWLLVSKGADVKASTKDGCTVLHEAITAVGGADRGNEELVELLISMGADSKAKNSDGKTALHLAIEKRNQAVVRMLKTEKWESKRRRTTAGRQQVRQRARFLEALAHQ